MIIEPHFETIVEHFNAEYPREGCGVIAIVQGKSKWFPCKNVAENDDDFIIDSKDYIKASYQGDIVAVVHSHPDASPEPSETDVKQCNGLNLDYYIISIPEIQLEHLKPNRVDRPLIGREYEFGVNDCFSLVQSYYQKFEIEMPRYAFEDNWYDKGLDYFGDLWQNYEGWSEATDGSLNTGQSAYDYWQATVTTSNPGTPSDTNANFRRIRVYGTYSASTTYKAYTDPNYNEYVTYDRGSDDDFVRLWQIKGSTQTGSAHKSTPDFGDHWQLGDQCSKNVSGCAKRFRTSFATIDGSVRKTITEKDEMLPFGGFPGTKTRA